MMKIGGYEIPRYRNLKITRYKKVATDSEIVLATDGTDKKYIATLHKLAFKVEMCSKTEAEYLAAATDADLTEVVFTDLDGTEKTGMFRCEALEGDMTVRVGEAPYYSLNFVLEEEIV